MIDPGVASFYMVLPVSKLPATPEISHRRASLCEMVERGTRHERVVAAAKLAKLEARYDFSAVSHKPHDDLFQGCGSINTNGEDSVPLISVPVEDEEIGSYVKWAFLHKFGVDSHWKKTRPDASTLHANVDETAAKSLRPVAQTILSRFKQLWTQYSERNTLRAGQRKPFYCGLYDGMMQSPRGAGEKIPMFSGPRRKKKKKKETVTTAASAVETHPYEIGMALGEMIRVNAPLRAISSQLRILMKPESGS
jgi:hypothetical protein